MPEKEMRSKPELWFSPYRLQESAILADDEAIKMLMHYEIMKKEDKQKMHLIFAVIAKGNKAISRMITVHEDENEEKYCAGHTADLAEYPIENCEELKEETEQCGAMIGKMTMEDPEATIEIDTEKPIFLMKIPKEATNENLSVIMSFAADKQPKGDIPKQVITNVLGLGRFMPQEIIDAIKEKEENFQIAPVDTRPSKKTGNNLEKAAKEMELIKKYGKKNIQELAKKINYKGELINKTKPNAK